MKKLSLFSTAVILIPLLILFSSQAFARSSENYCITVDVTNAGGTEIVDGDKPESENYYLFGSIGQGIINVPQSLGDNHDLDAGFLYGANATSVPDDDGVCWNDDNCPTMPNGLDLGFCTKPINENMVIITWDTCDDDGDCVGEEYCDNQGDINQNGCGDACECESDFDGDGDQDWDDVDTFNGDWGRNLDYNPCPPCEPENEPCEGDFDGDCDIDWDDVFKFLEDWGRNIDYRPCPACP